MTRLLLVVVLLVVIASGALSDDSIDYALTPENPLPGGTTFLDFTITNSSSFTHTLTIDKGNILGYTQVNGSTTLINYTLQAENMLATTHNWDFDTTLTGIEANDYFTTQDVTVNLDIPTETNQSFHIKGNFSYTAGQGIPNAKFIVKAPPLCSSPAYEETGVLRTSSTGSFDWMCNLSGYEPTGTYPVTVTAFWDGDTSRANTKDIMFYGKTQTEYSLEITPLLAESGEDLQVVAKWEKIKGSDIKGQDINITITFDEMDVFTSQLCKPYTSYLKECTHTCLLSAPEPHGTYPVKARFEWTDRQGTSWNQTITETLEVKETISLKIPATEISMGINLDENKSFNLTLDSMKSNIPLIVSLEENPYIKMDDTLTNNSITTANITAKIPYSYTKNTYQKNLIFTDNETTDKHQVFFDFTINQPLVYWEENVETTYAGKGNATITLTLFNEGGTAKNIKITPTCPREWTCEVSPSELTNLTESQEIIITYTPAQTITQTVVEIGITAEDEAGRQATTSIQVNVNAMQYECTVDKEQTTHTFEVGTNYQDNIYFIGGAEGVFERATPDETSGVPCRSQRAEAVIWETYLHKTSAGVGDVCEVWVRVGNDNHKLSLNPDDKIPLFGGECAFEYIKFLKPGVCKPVIGYNNKTTEAYLVLEAQQYQPPTGILTSHDETTIAKIVDSKLKPQEEQNFWTSLGQGIILLAFALIFFVFGVLPKLKGKPLYTKEQQPRFTTISFKNPPPASNPFQKFAPPPTKPPTNSFSSFFKHRKGEQK